MTLDVFAAVNREFFSYADFLYGWDMLCRRLPHARWHMAYTDDLPVWLRDQPERVADCDGEVILITAPHILLSRNGLEGLRRTLHDHPDDIAIPLALAQANLPFTLDYSTVRGLDRVLERNQHRHLKPYPATGNGSKVWMMRASTLKSLLASQWSGALPANTWVSPQAVAHDYSAYHDSDRAEVVPHLPHGVKRLLDIGGGCGSFAALAKRELLCEAHVFEQHPAAAAIARQRVDRVWEGEFPGALLSQMPRFDCVTALDVIEHIENTEACLEAIAALLLPQGHLVASLPNLGHWSVVLDLLEGYWDYAPVGIASRSHLRFFTRRTVCDLFEGLGWQVEAIAAISVPMPENMRRPLAALGEAIPLQIDAGSLDTYQYIIRARRP